MIGDNDWHTFARLFPTLGSEKHTERLIRANGILRHVNAGDVLYREGDECTHLPLVVSGELLLTKHAESGRAITLYRVEGGESCILSTLSILNDEVFPAEATSRSSSTLLLVPADALRRLIDQDGTWRRFVFSMYHRRLSGLIALIEEVVFGKLDLRLAELLLEMAADHGTSLRTTHQEIAEELGSSREVVSRLLKEWERQGVVELRRGEVSIRNRKHLEKIAR
jgi:CRP/FNR family transcriptional regulator